MIEFKLPEKTVETLYTAADIQRVRELLVARQGGYDPITDDPILAGQAVLDHCHTSQHVRGALDRQTNAFEGLVFNAYKRCLKWKTKLALPTILRNLALYLEYNESFQQPFIHNGWIKRVKTDFNNLIAAEQDEVIARLGGEESKNGAARKKQFSSLILNREYNYHEIKQYINEAKETNDSTNQQ